MSGAACALAAVVFWGVSFVATRIALESFHPIGLVSLRFAAATVFLGALVRARGSPLLPRRDDRIACMLLGAILGAHLLLQSYGLLHTTAIHTGWIIGFIPVTIALGSHFFLRERIRGTGWAGVALGTTGVLLVTMSSPPDFARARLGDLLQIVSCLTWTVYTLAAVRPVRQSGAARVTLFATGVAALVTLPGAASAGFLVARLNARSAAAALFLALFASGAAYALWFRALRLDGAARIGALLYLEPFVTLAAALALLSEPVTAPALVGGPLVLAGVALVRRAPGPRSAPVAALGPADDAADGIDRKPAGGA